MKPRSPFAAQRGVLLSWLPALAGMALLFYTSSLPGDRVHLPDFYDSDKVVHASAYCALGILISWRKSLRQRFAPVPADSPAARTGVDIRGLAAGMFYGVADEIHQIFVPMRSYDYADMAADALGVAIGCWAYSRWSRRSVS